jgi:pimeloyl-ACP methyl ester carboxylesterase
MPGHNRSTSTGPALGPLRRELRAVAAAALTLPAGLRRSTSPLPVLAQPPTVRPLRAHPPIVLIHGYCGNPATLAPLVRGLRARGCTDIRTFGYSSYGTDIPRLAARLARELAGLAQLSPSDPGVTGVHLVGHSLGGLILRFALAEFGSACPARSATTIATPHRGAALAHLSAGALARDLRPNSSLLRQLDRQGLDPAIPWTAYYSDADKVVAAWSAILDESPASNVRNRLIPGHGHVSIVGSNRLADDLAGHLAPHPAAEPGDFIPAQRHAS